MDDKIYQVLIQISLQLSEQTDLLRELLNLIKLEQRNKQWQ